MSRYPDFKLLSLSGLELHGAPETTNIVLERTDWAPWRIKSSHKKSYSHVLQDRKLHTVHELVAKTKQGGCSRFPLLPPLLHPSYCHSLPTFILPQNHEKETALHCAAQYGHSDVVSVLLHELTDPTMRNSRQETPLDLAALYGRLEVSPKGSA